MLIHHSKLEGIHLASFFPQKPWELQIAIVITIVVAVPLYRWYRRNKETIIAGELSPIHRLHLLTSFSLWSLLVGYHRAYDAVLYILVLSLGLMIYRFPESWELSHRCRSSLLFFIVSSTVVFMLPAGSLLRDLLPANLGSAWINISVRTTSLLLLAALAATIFLLFRYREGYEVNTLMMET